MNRKVYATPESLRSWRFEKCKKTSKIIIARESERMRKDEIFRDWVKLQLSIYFDKPIGYITFSKKTDAVMMRDIGVYVTREQFNARITFEKIGELWGYKTKSGAYVSYKKVKSIMDVDIRYKEDVEAIQKLVR